MKTSHKRVITFFTIAIAAMVFPWWIWISLLILAALWFKPYWEGVLILFMFEHMYGAILESSALLMVGPLPIRLWMTYLVLVCVTLLWREPQPHRVY
jgi:hypothetical protein